MSEPTVGQTYALTADHGIGPGSIPSGTQLEVVEVVPGGTPGVGGGEEDIVILQMAQDGVVLEDGEAVPGTTPRLVSMPVSVLEGITDGG